MAKALQVDWALAKSLYSKRLPLKHIADTIGCKVTTLTCRINRERWRADIDAAVNKELAQRASMQRVDLPAIAQEIREGMAEDAREAMRNLRKLPRARTLTQMADREQVASSIVNRAWKTLGLDQTGSGTVVNIALLGTLSDLHTAEKAQQGHTVDVSASVPDGGNDKANQLPPPVDEPPPGDR